MENLLIQARRYQSETEETLAALAAVDTGTRLIEGIAAAGGSIGARLAEFGFALESIPAGEFGSHILARRPGRGRPLLLLGHLDTVHPAGSARKPAVSEGVMSGPGVYDCKGGLAVALMACRLWQATEWPECPLTFLINADEEAGSPTSRPSIEAEAKRSRAVLVVEPAPDPESVITARMGIGRYVLRVFGRAAHSGSHRKEGINALVELAAKILALERINDDAEGYSVTVGTAGGGVRPNVVPDYAQAEIDLRIARPERVEEALSALARAAAVSQVPGASYRMEGGITRPPMPAMAETQKLFETARGIAAKMGLELRAASSGGGSDANFCAAMGAPVLDGLGPAGGGAHAQDEHVILSSLPVRGALLAALAIELGRGETCQHPIPAFPG